MNLLKAQLLRLAAIVLTASAAHAQYVRQPIGTLDKPLELPPKSPLRIQLLGWAARYLGREMHEGKPLDPVARFHLGNGARVERINWAADPSPKGLKQSFGLMVNYVYDPRRLDKHRALLSQGQVPISGAIEDLYL